MNRIQIQYDPDTNEYFFDCPFCKHRVTGENGEWQICEHVLLAFGGYEQIPIFFSDDLRDRVTQVLMSKRINFLEGIYDSWDCQYQPQERRSEDEEAWDEAKAEAINDYLDEGLTIDDFLKTLRCSGMKPMLKKIVIAETGGCSGGVEEMTFVLCE